MGVFTARIIDPDFWLNNFIKIGNPVRLPKINLAGSIVIRGKEGEANSIIRIGCVFSKRLIGFMFSRRKNKWRTLLKEFFNCTSGSSIKLHSASTQNHITNATFFEFQQNVFPQQEEILRNHRAGKHNIIHIEFCDVLKLILMGIQPLSVTCCVSLII